MREIRVKTMIEGQSTQTIRVQPFAYSAAEKLHAIVDKGIKNTRMKDYRDLLVLARKGFDYETVRQAIEHTFRQRATELPDGAPVGLTQQFVDVAQADWSRYLENNRITGMLEDFGEVVAELDAYYTPLMQNAPSFSYVFPR